MSSTSSVAISTRCRATASEVLNPLCEVSDRPPWTGLVLERGTPH
jgi:hypothetical protein